MKKEDFIQEDIELLLKDIDFITKYELISQKFRKSDESYKISNNEILDIAREIGFAVSYSKEKEFHLEEVHGNYQLKIGFTVRFNSIEIGFSIANEAKQIRTSAPWGLIVKLMTNGTQKIGKPKFENLTNLRGILEGVLSIYNDIKSGLIKNV